MVPDAIDLASIRRALVIKLRHHGDVLLTSPVFQVLKNHAPRRIGIQPFLDERHVVFIPGREAEAKVSRLFPENVIHMHGVGPRDNPQR
jgi:hypothetical protein